MSDNKDNKDNTEFPVQRLNSRFVTAGQHLEIEDATGRFSSLGFA